MGRVTNERVRAGMLEMDSITSILNGMKKTENRLLRERISVREGQTLRLKRGLAVLTGGALVAMALVFWWMSGLARARRQAQAHALHLAHHDTLTGLPNRRLLDDRMTIALASGKRHGDTFAVLCLDLDGFKRVNDT